MTRQEVHDVIEKIQNDESLMRLYRLAVYLYLHAEDQSEPVQK